MMIKKKSVAYYVCRRGKNGKLKPSSSSSFFFFLN